MGSYAISSQNLGLTAARCSIFIFSTVHFSGTKTDAQSDVGCARAKNARDQQVKSWSCQPTILLLLYVCNEPYSTVANIAIFVYILATLEDLEFLKLC